MSTPLSGPGSATAGPGPGARPHRVPRPRHARTRARERRADHRDRPRRQGDPARPGGRDRDLGGLPAHRRRDVGRPGACWWRPPPALFYLYLGRRHIPAKYLVPGTLFLIAFQVVPVLYTASTAFTNFGDGHRGSKDDAIVAIESSSVTQVPGSAEYTLSIATKGDPATGAAGLPGHRPGNRRGLRRRHRRAAPARPRRRHGRAPAARSPPPTGYTVLTIGQASARSKEITDLVVPTPGGALRSSGLSRAYEGKASGRTTLAATASGTAETGRTWTADDEAARSSPPTASGWPRAGRSTSG